MELILILLVILIILGGVGPWWPYSRGWGYSPLSVIFVIILIILLMRVL